MADAIAHEAGLEPREGQEAVAEVVMNRLRDPRFPKTVCGVVYQGSQRRTGCQFTFTCDGSLRRRMTDRVMATARDIARAALGGMLQARVAGATFYHADYVSPRWAPRLSRVAKIGAHIFYRGGGWSPAAIAVVPERPIALTTEPPHANRTLQAAPPFAPWGLTIMAGTARLASSHDREYGSTETYN